MTDVGRRLGLMGLSPDFLRLLRYGRAVDVTRLEREVGYQPRFDAAAAVADYAGKQRGKRVAPTLREAVAR